MGLITSQFDTAPKPEALGRSRDAVRKRRQRLGRYTTGAEKACSVCGERPVFAESAQARRWGLCKACYLRERQRRIDEERTSASVRQAAKRARDGRRNGR